MKTLKNELKTIKKEIFENVNVRVFYTLPSGKKSSMVTSANLLKEFEIQLKQNKCEITRKVQEA